MPEGRFHSILPTAFLSMICQEKKIQVSSARFKLFMLYNAKASKRTSYAVSFELMTVLIGVSPLQG